MTKALVINRPTCARLSAPHEHQELQRPATREEGERADGVLHSRTRPEQGGLDSKAFSKARERTAAPDSSSDQPADKGTDDNAHDIADNAAGESTHENTDQGTHESTDESADNVSDERPSTNPLLHGVRGPQATWIVRALT
jgi:hypothetical protein